MIYLGIEKWGFFFYLVFVIAKFDFFYRIKYFIGCIRDFFKTEESIAIRYFDLIKINHTYEYLIDFKLIVWLKLKFPVLKIKIMVEN